MKLLLKWSPYLLNGEIHFGSECRCMEGIYTPSKDNFVYGCATLWSAPHDFCKSYKNVGRTLQQKDGEKVYNVTVLNSPTLRNNRLKQRPASLVPSAAGSQNVFAPKIEPYARRLVSLIQLFFVRIQHH